MFDLQQEKWRVNAAGEVSAAAQTFPARPGAMTLEEQVTACYERWRGGIYRYLAAAFGSPAQAEELTQDAFLQMHRVLQRGQTIENPRAWLYRVAHNAALNQIKSQQFILPVEGDMWEDLCRALPDAGLNPEQSLLEQEKLDRLRRAMGRLTESERQCLHLRTKGLRYREIAEIVGLGVSTVAETLYRVIDKLAQETQ
jgi:RNA polymerase sigma-70 factor (ECF subfamily)